MLSSKCAIYDSKNSRFIGEKKNGLLSSLGIRTPLSKNPLLVNI